MRNNDDRHRLIFIAGCGHSGTTLLELLLSTHTGVYGLGETAKLVDDQERPKYVPREGENKKDRMCSCGESINECGLWSRFLERTQEEPDIDFPRRYGQLVDIATDELGSDVILSDSSKYLNSLRQITDTVRSGVLQPHICPDDLFVVHFVKDARAWVTSMRDRYELDRWDLVQWYRKWHQDNQQIRSFLDEENLPNVRVTYEELCFRPRGTLAKIFDAAGIEESGPVGELSSARAHISFGNPMRNDEHKSTHIEYDPRWFYEPFIQFIYYLIPGIRSYNENNAKNVMRSYLDKRV